MRGSRIEKIKDKRFEELEQARDAEKLIHIARFAPRHCDVVRREVRDVDPRHFKQLSREVATAQLLHWRIGRRDPELRTNLPFPKVTVRQVFREVVGLAPVLPLPKMAAGQSARVLPLPEVTPRDLGDEVASMRRRFIA